MELSDLVIFGVLLFISIIIILGSEHQTTTKLLTLDLIHIVILLVIGRISAIIENAHRSRAGVLGANEFYLRTLAENLSLIYEQIR